MMPVAEDLLSAGGGLSERVLDALRRDGVVTRSALALLTDTELKRIPRIGPRARAEIKRFLKDRGTHPEGTLSRRTPPLLQPVKDVLMKYLSPELAHAAALEVLAIVKSKRRQ